MAWFDIVGGLARGAQQGIGQFQQQQQQARENALKDALEKRTQATFQRQEAEEARTLMLDEMSRQDPDNLDPAWVASKGAAIAPYIQKRPDGALAVRRDPLAEAQRRNALATAEDAPGALAALQEERALAGEERGFKRATVREKTAAAQTWGSPTFDNLSDRAKIRAGEILGKSVPEIGATLKNPDAYYRSTSPAAVIAANATIQAGREASARAALGLAGDMERAQLQAQGESDKALQALVGKYVTEYPDATPEDVQAFIAKVRAGHQQAGGLPPGFTRLR